MKLHNHISVFVTSAAVLFALTASHSLAQDVSAAPQSANQTKSPGLSESLPAAGVNLATCSPDGEFFVSANPNGHVKYGRTRDGRILRTWYQCQPKAMVFSPDGRLLAAAGRSSGCLARIKVWRAADGALLCKIQTETGSNPRLSFSSDGTRRLSFICSGESRVVFLSLRQNLEFPPLTSFLRWPAASMKGHEKTEALRNKLADSAGLLPRSI